MLWFCGGVHEVIQNQQGYGFVDVSTSKVSRHSIIDFGVVAVIYFYIVDQEWICIGGGWWCGMMSYVNLERTKCSFRFLCRWYAMTGGVSHIWEHIGSSWMYDQWRLRMDDSGERFWWYGMTNGSVWLVVVVLLLASNCAWLCDEAMSMQGRISLTCESLTWISLIRRTCWFHANRESEYTDHFMKPDKWVKILVLLRTSFSSYFLLFYFHYHGNCVFVQSVSQRKVQTFAAHNWANELEKRYLVLIKFDFGVVVQSITNSFFTIQNVSIALQSWVVCQHQNSNLNSVQVSPYLTIKMR